MARSAPSDAGLAVDSAQKFTGQVRDPQTGMDYFNARYSEPAVMQFTGPDPGRRVRASTIRRVGMDMRM